MIFLSLLWNGCQLVHHKPKSMSMSLSPSLTHHSSLSALQFSVCLVATLLTQTLQLLHDSMSEECRTSGKCRHPLRDRHPTSWFGVQEEEQDVVPEGSSSLEPVPKKARPSSSTKKNLRVKIKVPRNLRTSVVHTGLGEGDCFLDGPATSHIESTVPVPTTAKKEGMARAKGIAHHKFTGQNA